MQNLFDSRAGMYGFADVPECVVKGLNAAAIFHVKPPQRASRSVVAKIGQGLPGLGKKTPFPGRRNRVFRNGEPWPILF